MLYEVITMGGVVQAIDRGYVQKEIQDAAFRYQQEIERKDRIIVGMNEFETKEPKPENLLTVDPKIEKGQRQRLASLRRRRDDRARITSYNVCYTKLLRSSFSWTRIPSLS